MAIDLLFHGLYNYSPARLYGKGSARFLAIDSLNTSVELPAATDYFWAYDDVRGIRSVRIRSSVWVGTIIQSDRLGLDEPLPFKGLPYIPANITLGYN